MSARAAKAEPAADVLIVGAGPTGLMLAGELALAGVGVGVLERRAGQTLSGLRAGGLHARTIEILDQRGIADRFLAEGQTATAAQFAGMRLDIGDLPTRQNCVLALWQTHIERILAGWTGELGVPVHRGQTVVGLAQDDIGVDVELADGRSLRTRYLVGCDGGRSLVRKAAGIDFPGSAPTTSSLIAEVEMAGEPPYGMRRDTLGVHSIGRLADTGRMRVLVTERTVGPSTEPSLRDLAEALRAVYGSDYGVHSPTWISRFTDSCRQAATYRKERVLLAGDAAHVHPPDGGQGLQTGVQDAVNLGWKLAQVVRGTTPDSLLDSYHCERHPVAARVLRNTQAAVALRRADDRTQALRDVLSELLDLDEPRRHVAAMLSGLDIRYDCGEGHPLLGRRMPDLAIATGDGPCRIFALLRDARPVLLNLGAPGGLDIASWTDRVRLVEATCEDAWELPVLGVVGAPAALLIRPDGHVAWVGHGRADGLADALTRWFGPPAAGAVEAPGGVER